MVRGFLLLGLLAGAGWYAYRRLVGSGSDRVTAEGGAVAGDGAAAEGGVRARVSQSVSQAAAAARQAATKVAGTARAVATGRRDEPSDLPTDAEPPEVRAAVMAGMPAVQPPATIPEPELRAP